MTSEEPNNSDVETAESPPAPRRAFLRRLALRGGRVVEVSSEPDRETR